MTFFLQKVKDLPVIPKNTKVPSQLQRAITKLLWLFSTARNIIVVIICAIMAWLIEIHRGESPVILTGHVKQGLPEFRVPPFETRIGNETYTFFDMISSLGSGCVVIPMLSLLESISIAKVFCKNIIHVAHKLLHRRGINICFFSKSNRKYNNKMEFVKLSFATSL